MNPELLKFYNQELQHLRDMGGEFAAAFPSIAGRLGLNGFECQDPYVERLLEGFSFLAARVHMKMDEQFPRFARHLIDVIAPHYLSPTPSMAVVQCEPDWRHPDLPKGVRLPRHTTLHSRPNRHTATRCEFRTAHELTLWPLRLTKADYSPYNGVLDDAVADTPRPPKAVLRLRFETTLGSVAALSIDRIPLYLRGSHPFPAKLYEHITGHTVAVLITPAKTAASRHMTLPPDCIRPLGFDDQEALLPVSHRDFHGHRLLHEYFAFPERFLFLELADLRDALGRCDAQAFDVVLVLDHWDATLENRVDASNFALYCTPVINLFPHRTDRMAVHDGQHDYRLIVDRMRPRDFEVHTVEVVRGYRETQREPQRFMPFYHAQYGNTASASQGSGYFQVRRELCELSERERARGIRTHYPGSEVFVALVDAADAPYASDLRQIGVDVLCTNRDLPLYMPIGGRHSDFSINAAVPVASVRCVAGPSDPQSQLAQGASIWRFLKALTFNYLPMFGPGGAHAGDTPVQALRELLSLHCRPTDRIAGRQIDGLQCVSAKPVTRRLPGPGPISFGRGLEVTLTWDDEAIDGHGAFPLGAVLHSFFASYVSINHFTETVMRTPGRGEIARWTPRMGTCPIL